MAYTPETLAEHIVNGMSHKELVRYVLNDMEEWLGDMDEREFEDQLAYYLDD